MNQRRATLLARAEAGVRANKPRMSLAALAELKKR